MTAHFANPPPDAIRQLLLTVSTMAVVGLSPNPARPSHVVAEAMQHRGYRIIPVRPGGGRILGESVFDSLGSITEPVDLVDVFRAPEHVDGIVDECIEQGIRALWLQDGVVNVPAAERAKAAGCTVVMDRCVLRDHLQLVGRLSKPRGSR